MSNTGQDFPSGQDPNDQESGPTGSGAPPPPPSSGGGAPPPPPQGQTGGQQAPSGAGQPAELGVRFIARVIDHILLFIVTLVIIVPLFIGLLFTDAAGGGSAFGFGASLSGIITSIITAAITIGYFAFMESSRGQTVGKMLMNLKTLGPQGGNPTIEQATKRNAWYALAIVPFIGWLAQLAAAIYIAVTINQSDIQQGWHDTFGDGTRVVKTS